MVNVHEFMLAWPMILCSYMISCVLNTYLHNRYIAGVTGVTRVYSMNVFLCMCITGVHNICSILYRRQCCSYSVIELI